MASYQLTADGLFYVQEGEEWKCLVSFWDYYKNAGALPLHTYEDDKTRILPAVLQNLRAMYGMFAGERQNAAEEFSCMIAASMILDQSMLGYRPLRILEAAERPGAQTAMLAAAARRAHPDSRVYTLLADTSVNAFADLMKRLHEAGNVNRLDEANETNEGNPPDEVHRLDETRAAIKAIGGEPEDGLLREGWFDVTVVDGLRVMDKSAQNLRDAMQNMLRVTRPGGCLICLTQGCARVENCVLDWPGADADRYEIAPDSSMLVKKVAAGDYRPFPGYTEQVAGLHAKVQAIIGAEGEVSGEQLREIVAVLHEMETLAVRMFDVADVNLKQRVNEIKETALNALYTPREAFRKECLRKLRIFAGRFPC